MKGEIIGNIFINLAFFNLFVQFVASYIVYPLYKKYGWFKQYYHDVCGFHIPRDGTILICRYGLEKHAICKYCGKGVKQTYDGEWE